MNPESSSVLHCCCISVSWAPPSAQPPPRAPRWQAPRFSERIIADGDALLQRLAYLHVNHGNKDVRRAAGATLDAAQHQARPEPCSPTRRTGASGLSGLRVQDQRPGRAAGACSPRNSSAMICVESRCGVCPAYVLTRSSGQQRRQSWYQSVS